MALPMANLRVMERVTGPREPDLASELFHRINRVLPEEQKLLTVTPQTTAREAIELMKKSGYSQLPVVAGTSVLGVFSYRSFAATACKDRLDRLNQQKCAPGDLAVEEYLEQFEYVRFTEEMDKVFDALDKDNGVLIGAEDRLSGVLTAMDVLRYLHQFAEPFVMASEIEYSVRTLMRLGMNGDDLADCARLSLASVYEGRKVPTVLEDMSFDNYRQVIVHGLGWGKLGPMFGGTKAGVSGKLAQIRDIRNDLFHFKREITDADRETLSDHRAWLLSKIRKAGAMSSEVIK